MKKVKHIVIPYKFFNIYDYLSLNVALLMWYNNYNKEKTKLHIVCDLETKNILDNSGVVLYDFIEFHIYNKSVEEIRGKYPKMSKTILLNEELVMMYDKLQDDFIFASDDRFPICEINDYHFNKQHKKLGVYPKWNVKFDTNWKWLMEKGAKFVKEEYKVDKPILFKNHYFTKYDKDFIEWFRPYVTRFDLAQMLTYYHLYIKKDVKVKDIFIPNLIMTTIEFGKRNKINTSDFCSKVYGLSVSAPHYDVKLLQDLLQNTEIRQEDKKLVDKLLTIKQKYKFKGDK